MASPSTTNFSNFASCLSITGQPCCHGYSNMQLAAVVKPQVAVPVGMFLGEGLVALPAKWFSGCWTWSLLKCTSCGWNPGWRLKVVGKKNLWLYSPIKRRRAPVTDVLVRFTIFLAMVGALSTRYPDNVTLFNWQPCCWTMYRVLTGMFFCQALQASDTISLSSSRTC